MADIFGQAYLSSGSPVSIVTYYLSAYTKGEITDPPVASQPLLIKNYDIRKAYVACPFKGITRALVRRCHLICICPFDTTDVVTLFGIESILIYNALLLKKRVAVYASSLNTLLKFTRSAYASNSMLCVTITACNIG